MNGIHRQITDCSIKFCDQLFEYCTNIIYYINAFRNLQGVYYVKNDASIVGHYSIFSVENKKAV